MDEDTLLEQLRARVASGDVHESHSPATLEAIAEVERTVELRLPVFYVRLLTEVANGGFGPGYGIVGVPPDGFADDDVGGTMVDGYSRGRVDVPREWMTPRGFLPLCNWGCARYSYIDALSPDAAVVTEETLEQGPAFYETAPSLAGWLSAWLSGENVGETMYEIVGYEDGKNPFTGQPHRFPIRRQRGRRIDVSARG